MMSWKFLNPQDRAAIRRHQAVSAKIDRWWRIFQAKTQDLDDLFHRRKEWDLPAWMQRHLGDIDPRLMWEFSRDTEAGGHRLVITPESEKHLHPLVETILEKAPRISGWAFHGYRQPEPVESALETVEARTGATLPEVTVQAQIGEPNRIDLVYQSPRFSSQVDSEALHQIFVATESLLGEDILDKWIGAMEAAAPAKGTRSLPLEALQDTVHALIVGITDQLPDRPCHQLPDDLPWSLFKLHPEEDDDYPAKEDLFVGVTMMPNVLSAFLNGSRFYSSCFSRCGERFCYVKIDGSGDDAQAMRFADREEMEAALDRVLRPAQLGGVIGGGTGLRYSYIDLALTDVARGSRAVRDVLQDGRIPKRAWLLFCDCEWQGEWIGVWDDTPPPPVAAE
jgi:hypothetical protein